MYVVLQYCAMSLLKISHASTAFGVMKMSEPEFKCCECGLETPIANTTRPTYCERCCPDHDYEYDRFDQMHYCKHCGEVPPDDWHGYNYEGGW